MNDLIRFATARRSARAGLHGAWLDGGTLKVYSAPVPADADTAITSQTLLAAFDLPDPFGDEDDGVLTAATIPAALNLATGTAAWARAFDALGAAIGDYDVGATGSGAAVEMDNLSVVSGSLSAITSFVVTEG
ncbi:MAG: hypothetical protein RKR03_09265 [Candidatus Competibacter sp.]|nr:hypothetical protein [Candidatus Competibacter sp.]